MLAEFFLALENSLVLFRFVLVLKNDLVLEKLYVHADHFVLTPRTCTQRHPSLEFELEWVKTEQCMDQNVSFRTHGIALGALQIQSLVALVVLRSSIALYRCGFAPPTLT